LIPPVQGGSEALLNVPHFRDRISFDDYLHHIEAERNFRRIQQTEVIVRGAR
jgi:hypothetical protein